VDPGSVVVVVDEPALKVVGALGFGGPGSGVANSAPRVQLQRSESDLAARTPGLKR